MKVSVCVCRFSMKVNTKFSILFGNDSVGKRKFVIVFMFCCELYVWIDRVQCIMKC